MHPKDDSLKTEDFQTNLDRKIRLLEFVQQASDRTGQFAYAPFLPLLSARENRQQQPLSEQECFDLLSLVQSEVNRTGRFDQPMFIKWIEAADPVAPSNPNPEPNPQPHS